MRSHNMKLMKRAGIYKGSNVTFTTEKMEAFSYDWWQFVEMVGCDQSLHKDGAVVVFNHHGYSPSTNGHQSKVRSLLAYLGITIDIEVDSPQGLQATGWKQGCIKNAQETITLLEKKELKGVKGSLASDWRLEGIAKYKQMIKDVQSLD